MKLFSYHLWQDSYVWQVFRLSVHWAFAERLSFRYPDPSDQDIANDDITDQDITDDDKGYRFTPVSLIPTCTRARIHCPAGDGTSTDCATTNPPTCCVTVGTEPAGTGHSFRRSVSEVVLCSSL